MTTRGFEPGKGLARFPAITRETSTVRHVIEDIRSREEDPESNYILCSCDWRGQPGEYPQHQKEMGRKSR